MSSPTYNELALLLRGVPDGGTVPIFGAYVTAWDGVTRQNTVSTGAQTWANLAMINPTLLSTGPVLMIDTAAQPIILGRIYLPTGV